MAPEIVTAAGKAFFRCFVRYLRGTNGPRPFTMRTLDVLGCAIDMHSDLIPASGTLMDELHFFRPKMFFERDPRDF